MSLCTENELYDFLTEGYYPNWGMVLAVALNSWGGSKDA